jgi:hypothetical protein
MYVCLMGRMVAKEVWSTALHAVVLPQAVPKVNHPTWKIKENHTTWKISSSVVGIMIDLASCSDRAQQ